jgi:signal transduction histidine kinase/ligand-binding sensor protein
MDVKQYLDAVTPLNVPALLDHGVLDILLSGYSFTLKVGITLVYPTARPATSKTLARTDAMGAEAPSRTFHPLCEYWRDADGCNQKDCCTRADDCHVLKYCSGEWSTPKLYRCKPLALWDMTYPLRIESQIVGVLFGGQILVDSNMTNWREALRECNEFVDWTTCPNEDSHIKAVETTITNHSISQRCKQGLLDILRFKPLREGPLHSLESENKQRRNRILRPEAATDLRTVPLNELRRRFAEFQRFGNITQVLLDELHKVRQTAAEQKLLRTCADELAGVDLTESAQWWEESGRLLGSLTALPEIEAIQLYARKRSRYLRESPPSDPANRQPLPTREAIAAFPAGRLVPVPDAVKKELMADLAPGRGNVWGYRSETGVGREVCSSLVVFRGAVSEVKRGFLTSLCNVICAAADSASLIFRERAADSAYRRTVAWIGHSFRTPLQVLQFELEDLEKAPAVATSPGLLEKARNAMALIRDAREDVLFLLLESAAQEERFDLIGVLGYVLKSMEPSARKQQCALVRRGEWPPSIWVRGIRYRVQRALNCLLDNAIKYSYCGQRREGGLYEVRVWIIAEDHHVRVSISNYGIGIPEEKLSAIRGYGFRAAVADKKKSRLGTGLGLPFAINVFEELGGWIHLTSVAAESATEGERSTYHRYVTTVEAALPIARRK